MQRDENQDAMGTFVSPRGTLFVVLDGMGGHVGGRVASHTALEAIGSMFKKAEEDEDEPTLLDRLIREANGAILKRGIASPELLGMGTTCVLLLVSPDGSRAHHAHVGDSRIYLLRDEVMRQLTKDHTTVQRLIDEGRITEEQAPMHHQAGVISRSVGVAPELEIDVTTEPVALRDHDLFLLCSDGLTTMLDDDSIVRYLKEVPYDEVGRELIALANARGGYDNITLELVQLGPSRVANGPTKSGLVRLSDLLSEQEADTARAMRAEARSQQRVIIGLVMLLLLLGGLIVWAW